MDLEKKKHKQLAVYMTLGKILPHNRSCIEPVQLVMLCRESDYQFFGHGKMFSSLIKDLKDNEQSGITLESGETVQSLVTTWAHIHLEASLRISVRANISVGTVL